MKKISFKNLIKSITLATIGATTGNGGYTAHIRSATFNSNKVILDGKELDLGGQQLLSVIKDGETDINNYMPAQGVLQAMGYNVYWDEQKKAVVVNSQSKVTKASGTVNVGVCIFNFSDNFMTEYRTELAKHFAVKNTADVKYNVTFVDGKNDPAIQTDQINKFISQGVDVLIINLLQPSSAAKVIDTLKAFNIPAVFINRELAKEDMNRWDKICYVGADARQSGSFQGEIIRDLPHNGDINGNGMVDYVMIMGDPENIDAKYRTEFSIKALTDAGIAVNKLDEQAGAWGYYDGHEIAANALEQHGDMIDVIFCNNDGMALGAYEAIEAAGRKVGEDIYLVGVDAIHEAVDAIRLGKMTGTVLNDHIKQSHAAVAAAIKLSKGEPVDKYYMVDYVKIIK